MEPRNNVITQKHTNTTTLGLLTIQSSLVAAVLAPEYKLQSISAAYFRGEVDSDSLDEVPDEACADTSTTTVVSWQLYKLRDTGRPSNLQSTEHHKH